ncbi:hypothetical protein DEO72_LG2g3761 [Vigna unguiculata]|uniref:Uncharacterized protein n=1 Tax=Vigna unguiculata TaxID=3917 RepID=A0A4D6L4H8_VIGUN|nr:hypothetical protein DEO72_LG2g3761 [Vigna unguiculata]
MLNPLCVNPNSTSGDFATVTLQFPSARASPPPSPLSKPPQPRRIPLAALRPPQNERQGFIRGTILALNMEEVLFEALFEARGSSEGEPALVQALFEALFENALLMDRSGEGRRLSGG